MICPQSQFCQSKWITPSQRVQCGKNWRISFCFPKTSFQKSVLFLSLASTLQNAWNILTSIALTNRIRYRNVVESRGLLWTLSDWWTASPFMITAVEENACAGGVCHRSTAYLPPRQLHCVAVLLRRALHWGFQHYLYSQHVPAAIRDTKFDTNLTNLPHVLDNTCFRLWVSLLGVLFIFMHDT